MNRIALIVEGKVLVILQNRLTGELCRPHIGKFELGVGSHNTFDMCAAAHRFNPNLCKNYKNVC